MLIVQVPETSPFIHRDTNYFVFEGLEPETIYEVELDIIPVPGATKELYSGRQDPLFQFPFFSVYLPSTTTSRWRMSRKVVCSSFSLFCTSLCLTVFLYIYTTMHLSYK